MYTFLDIKKRMNFGNLKQVLNDSESFLFSIIDDINENGSPLINMNNNSAHAKAAALAKSESNSKSRIGDITVNPVITTTSSSNQEQKQVQSQEVELLINAIFSAIDEELTGKQRKELKEIIQSASKPEEKKKNFVQKLTSFGTDVSANVLAGLILNPELIDRLGGML